MKKVIPLLIALALIVVFGACEYLSKPVSYVLTVLHEGNGSVVVTPEKDKYKFNETVSLEAVPDEGWKFTQ